MRSLVLVLTLLVPRLVFGSEPPRETVEQALAVPGTVFIGRIVEAKETEYRDNQVRAVAKVVITRNLRGLACSEQAVSLSYTVSSKDEQEYSAGFKVGTYYLFVLRPRGPGRACTVRFVSKYGDGGVDFAFEAGEEPKVDIGVAFLSIYRMGKPAVFTLGQLESLVQEQGAKK